MCNTITNCRHSDIVLKLVFCTSHLVWLLSLDIPLAGEESYLAVDKGAINWGHVLVLPIEHHRCGLALPPATYAEMMRFLSALRSCYAAQASVPMP